MNHDLAQTKRAPRVGTRPEETVPHKRVRPEVSMMAPRARANLAATLVYIMLGPEALHDLADELRMLTPNRSDVWRPPDGAEA